MRQIGFRLPDSLAARFEAYAADFGSRSEAIRALMDKALLEAPQPTTGGVAPSTGATRKIVFSIEGAELERLEVEAAGVGMSCTEWVRACVRSRLSAQRQLNKVERSHLRQALQELRAMREHLSRMRNSLQRAVLMGHQVERQLGAISAFDEKLAQAVAAIRLGFLGNDHYWDALTEPDSAADAQGEATAPRRLRGVRSGGTA